MNILNQYIWYIGIILRKLLRDLSKWDFARLPKIRDYKTLIFGSRMNKVNKKWTIHHCQEI